METKTEYRVMLKVITLSKQAFDNLLDWLSEDLCVREHLKPYIYGYPDKDRVECMLGDITSPDWRAHTSALICTAGRLNSFFLLQGIALSSPLYAGRDWVQVIVAQEDSLEGVSCEIPPQKHMGQSWESLVSFN